MITCMKRLSQWLLKYGVGHCACAITLGVAIAISVALRGSNSSKVVSPSLVNASLVEPQFKSPYGVYTKAAVASDSKTCNDIGRDIMLLHGGNAIDAAVATVMCSGIVFPHSTGIGGGLVAILYHRTHGWQTIDAREAAPMAATAKMYKTDVKAKVGGKAIAVPGFVLGLKEMHGRFGSLPWKTVLSPTIKLLEEGVPLTVQTHEAVVRLVSPKVVKMRGYEMFLDENKQLRQPGDLIKMPKLTKTIKTLAEDPSSFYTGALAKDIAQDVKDDGGIITSQDMANYTVRFKNPTKVGLRDDVTLYSVPPPASGTILSYIMSILNGYNITRESVSTKEKTILTYHRYLEALKFANAKKYSFGDEAFVDVVELTENMTSESYGEETRRRITDSRTQDLFYYEPKFYGMDDHGTSHTSVVDPEGNAVAITSSINMYFGSRVVGDRTGIIFNDQMLDFSFPHYSKYYGLEPAEPNFIQAGKRPASTMSPTIVWDNKNDKVSIVTGAAGSKKISACLASSLIDLLWLKLSVPESLDKPRIYHELLPTSIQAESTFDKELQDGLKEKGHSFLPPTGFTVVQIIQVLKDAIVAGSDFRKGGGPSGF